MRPLHLAPLLLAACTPDYGLNPKDDNNGPIDSLGLADSRDTGSPAVDACEEPTQPAGADVPLNEECAVSLQTGSFTPVVEWSFGSGSFCGPPAVAQLVDSNGSGALDSQDLPAVLMYNGGRVIALRGDGAGPFWASSGTNLGQDGGFATGDIDNDGWPEVVVANATTVCALDGQTGAQQWCTPGLGAGMDPYGYNYPSIADMDADGVPEVTVGNIILRGPNGQVRGRGSRGKGAAPYGGSGTSTYGALSVPIDLDGDGRLELVTGNAAYDADGTAVWSNAGLDGLVAVADFDGDGQGEIVKTSGVHVRGMETDGTEVWGPITYTGNLGAPAVDDLDGDGTPEIVFAAQNALIAMEWGGTVIWRATIVDNSGAAGPVLFDFEMDGYPEVLFADETSIRFFSGLDGTLKYSNNQHSSYTILETPVVADVDGDDQVEIVLGHCTGNASIGALTVYGDADQTWPPGRKVWNQHAYTITNIEDLGGVPSGQGGNNFRDYNSFRSGDVGRPPSEYWDLLAEVLDVCEDECDTGRVYVAARVRNAGNLDLPANIPLSLRAGAGGPVLATTRTTQATLAGRTGEVVRFEANSADLAGLTPVVTADEDGAGVGIVFECEEANNAASWRDTVCD